jgi:hypothetical protein
MARTHLRIDRIDHRYTVQVGPQGTPVAFAGRAEALCAALDIARAKWDFAGEPTAVSFPTTAGTDVLLFGGASNDEEEE